MKSKISGLAKKTDYGTKVSEIEKKQLEHDHSNKYVTTQEFNRLEIFTARLKQKSLACKNNIADLVEKKNFDDKLKNLNKKVTSNKTKQVVVEKKLTDLIIKVKQI